MQLLEAATHCNQYDYYHLLSGSCLPLVSQDRIHQFFDAHQGEEFLTFSEEGGYSKIYERVRYHYHISKWTPRYTNNKFSKLCIRFFRKFDILIQKLLKKDYWNACNGDLTLKYGSNWFSITDELARYVLNHREWIRDSFQYSYLCDELFLHTLVFHSPFYQNVYIKDPVHDIPDELQGNMCYINWWDGTPYTWNISNDYDCQQLDIGIQLGHLFARKFDLSEEQIERIEIKRTWAH